MTKIKEDLIHKAKVKKAYRKLKAELEEEKISRPRLPAHDQETNGQDEGTEATAVDDTESPPQMNPERQAMLESDAPPPQSTFPERKQRVPKHLRPFQPPQDSQEEVFDLEARRQRKTADPVPSAQKEDTGERRNRGKHRKPGYYDKALAKADAKRAEAEAKMAEQKRREEERSRKIADREKMHKAMLKARKPSMGRGKNGKPAKQKLGRESKVLLHKVKMMVGDSK